MTRDEFLEGMRDNPRPVVVDVWATWCMPCRQMAPALDRVGKEFAGRVDVRKLDADRDPELVRSLDVLGIPTLIVYRQGQEVARRVGLQYEDGLRALFASAESGGEMAPAGLPRRERLFRIGTAALLAVVSWVAGPSLLILALAGLVFFSGVYDRCPIWQALAPRLSALLRRQAPTSDPSANG